MKKTVDSWKKPKKMASVLGREGLEPFAGKDLRYLLRVLGAHILNVFVWLNRYNDGAALKAVLSADICAAAI